MNNRLLHLDSIKGVAIVWVVMGHVIWNADDHNIPMYSYTMQFINAVHMPLFVLLAGFFAQRQPSDFASWSYYWRDKICRLIVPAVLWMVCFRMWFDGSVEWRKIFVPEYWFTLSLFLCFVVFSIQQWFIKTLLPPLVSKIKNWQALIEGVAHLGIIVVLFYTHEWLTVHHLLPNTMVLERFHNLYVYFVIGFLIGKFGWLEKFQEHKIGAISFTVFIGSVMWFRYEGYSVPYLAYGLWHINRLMALASFGILVYVMARSHESNRRLVRYFTGLFTQLGQVSLPIYFVHFFFLPTFCGMRTYLNTIVPENRLLMELVYFGGGALLTLLPTLIIVYCIRQNPLLNFFLFGEVSLLRKK